MQNTDAHEKYLKRNTGVTQKSKCGVIKQCHIASKNVSNQPIVVINVVYLSNVVLLLRMFQVKNCYKCDVLKQYIILILILFQMNKLLS